MSKVAVIGIVGNSVFLPVANFHVGGETIEAQSIHFELGGKGFNQAVAAKRYGVDVSFLAAVGSDSYKTIAEFLSKEGITSTLIKKSDPTAFASIITDKKGRNRVTVYQGAQLSQNDVVKFEDEIRTADILLLSNEVAEDVNVKAIEIATKYNVKVLLNPAPYRKTCDYILHNVFLFTPNEHETEGLDNFNNVIETLGDKGCFIRNTSTLIPAEKVTAVDTTGAGDTFNGVLASCLAEDKSVEYACRTANIASGLKVQKKYVLDGIPYKQEIDNYAKND